MNLLARASDTQRFMGVSNETWSLWVEAAREIGLEIDCKLGTKEGWTLTTDLHALFRAKPQLRKRPSIERKERLERKRKK